MDIRNFEIRGRVIESQTRRGLNNLKVEAWDKDVRYHDLVGVAVTGGEGSFQISFDSGYFSESRKEIYPDLFFRVFAGKRLLKSTEDSPLFRAKEREEVTIEVDMPAVREVGEDRVTAAQIFRAAEFFQQSDFQGVYRQYRSKAGTSLGFLSDMVVNTIRGADLQPVQVKGVREEEVIGQTVDEVRKKMRERDVAVNEVRPYDPKLNSASLKSLRLFPADLRAGQRIDLYEENGKVRYYSIVREKPLEQADDNTEELRNRLNDVQKELEATRATIAGKDKQIEKLQQELTAVRKDQNEMNTVLKSEAFAQLLKEVQERGQEKKPAKRGPKKPPE